MSHAYMNLSTITAMPTAIAKEMRIGVPDITASVTRFFTASTIYFANMYPAASCEVSASLLARETMLKIDFDNDYIKIKYLDTNCQNTKIWRYQL